MITNLKTIFSKADIEAKIKRLSDDARLLVSGVASAAKLANWSRKAEIARLVKADNASTDLSDILKQEATLRGKSETATELADKIIAKANMHATKIGKIDGIEAKALLDIKTATANQLPTILAILKREINNI